MYNRTAALLARYPRMAEIAKYTTGCGLSVLVKIVVTGIATAFALPIWSGYLLAQIAVLGFGYFFHSQVTFRGQSRQSRGRWKEFAQFFRTVLLFKLIDYLLVVVGVTMLDDYIAERELLTVWQRQMLVSGCILATSAVIFGLRYWQYRTIFHANAEDGR